MKDDRIQQKIEAAFAQDTPDCFETVWNKAQQASKEQEGRLMEETKGTRKKSFWKYGAGFTAAAAACLVMGVTAAAQYRNTRIDTIIGLDVNPSVEFSVNDKNRVLKASPLNADAVEILEDMDLKGVDMKVAVNATIGSMVQKGYLDELKSTVLVTVDNEDPQKAEEIKTELTTDIQGILKENNIEGHIIDIALTKNETLKQLAQKYDISIGKAAYLMELVDEYAEFSMDELAPLTMDEISSLVIEAEIAREEADKAEDREKMTERDRQEAINEALEELQEMEREAKEKEQEATKPAPPQDKPLPPPETAIPPVMDDDDLDDLYDDLDDLDDLHDDDPDDLDDLHDDDPDDLDDLHDDDPDDLDDLHDDDPDDLDDLHDDDPDDLDDLYEDDDRDDRDEDDDRDDHDDDDEQDDDD